ncbi:DUF5704 domain-containing protein [Paenibacillus sp. alder61]|uniref:DUF5704 domain-containing protein n=1 Tax=Paenibacillus sp. alder61 TaxID=2862948 RepID=UPI00296E8401|nr:DUF5704 domain-containing protein [Paenibacillus sp. alder61]
MRVRFIFSFLLVLIFILLVSHFYPNQIESSSLPVTQDTTNPNVYYFVALFSYDIWHGTTWTKEGKPGDFVRISFDYSFDFPNRRIKKVEVRGFHNPIDWSNGENIWNTSRYTSANPDFLWGRVADYISTSFSSSLNGTVNGLGTSTVNFRVNVNGSLTTTLSGNISKDVSNESPAELGPGVVGYRYYFPTMLTIELEPQQGNAVIKHFTTTGQSLDGVDGFRDRNEKLVKDQRYQYFHSPETLDYKYEGYKKSTVSVPSGGAISKGDPQQFIYDGSFPTYYIYFYYTPNGLPPSGGCTVPAPGKVIESPLNSPDPSGVIKADSRGSEGFEVSDGIPTTESLYGNVRAKGYLSQNRFVEMSGKCTFPVTVNRTYQLSWDPGKTVTRPDGSTYTAPDPQSDTEERSYDYTIERPYSFWVIDNLEVYEISEAALWNYAFEGGGIRIRPTGYQPPGFATSKTGGFEAPTPPDSVEAPSRSISGGRSRPGVPTENLKSYAESAVQKVKVRNDSFSFNGGTIMNGSSTEQSGPTPGNIPEAAQINENVLYSPGNVIPTSKINRADQPSTGAIYYSLMSGNINGGADVNYPIYGINPVTVHTPVVMYPDVSDDQAHNQKTSPARGRSAVILDRPFTVEMPNRGQHNNYKRYGYNNYLKYIGSKQVRFPFDVYNADRTVFYPKNTWIEVDKARESFLFDLPVWVDEGYYEVEFMTVAHNAPGGATRQRNANLDLNHHIAYAAVPVDVIGRVYDFRVTDIADYNWESVFRTSPGSSSPTGAAYWVGLKGIDGDERGNRAPFTLPIRPGSHPLYRNAVVKTGYHFKFDLKTKGNMFGLRDSIRITPSFYFISAKDGARVPVDLYYHAGRRSYVKIGSAGDRVQRYVILNERLRHVPVEELTDTALYKYDHDYSFDQIAGISRSQYVHTYIEKIARQKTPVGRLSLLELNSRIRTFIGPKGGIPSGVNPARANASIQKWYGEYSLPADVYAVPAGTNVAEYGRTHNGLTERSPIFLRDGYIVVNFRVETVRNGESGTPHLQYVHAPMMNQWFDMEGFERWGTDPYGRRFTFLDGDVVFYDAGRSSRDDFRSLVTH